ncbi:MAG: winged helix-turn-helix transcriptional regulator [Longilinea sp.]|nr:winged helix-turn-helix transcriptional regulator [Longilinea sp.]MCA1954625.1 winged helix-turn-helix domain-containing protein [Anaerolinea sp.]
MTLSNENHRDLVILEQIENNPDATQASLAEQIGVAIGTINWHLKRLVEKGYVKVRRVERRKLRYIITPEGLALRARLTLDYIQSSFELYRLVRQRTLTLLTEARGRGITRLCLEGEGDVADVARLTCLEQGFELVDEGAPVLLVGGLKVFWKDEGDGSLQDDRKELL